MNRNESVLEMRVFFGGEFEDEGVEDEDGQKIKNQSWT